MLYEVITFLFRRLVGDRFTQLNRLLRQSGNEGRGIEFVLLLDEQGQDLLPRIVGTIPALPDLAKRYHADRIVAVFISARSGFPGDIIYF